MTSWIIIRTDPHKEEYVERQVSLLGFPAWVPMLAESHRVHRSTKRRIVTWSPLIARMLFAAVPVSREGDLEGIRYLGSLARDMASVALRISQPQIDIHRTALGEYNANVERLAAIGRGTKGKKGWVNLQDGLKALLATAGVEMEQEEAA